MTDAAELKLNIGGGTSGIEGWVNIDNSPSTLLSRLPLGKKIFRTPDWPRNVHRVDVRKRIPYVDEGAGIEHLFVMGAGMRRQNRRDRRSCIVERLLAVGKGTRRLC